MSKKEVAESLVGTTDKDPFPYYETLRATGEKILWDEGVKAWLLFDFDAIRDLGRQDDIKFKSPERMADNADDTTLAMLGGRRVVNYIEGEDHKRLHAWYL